MIIFKQLQFKNFFSYSNQLTTINFEDGMFLIMGKNGSGKSVIFDAIFYCLYGKSLRMDIKNNEIINRINNKNMLVKLIFDVNNVEYSIIRGLKPNVFQIWKNKEKLEEYNKKDMQKYVEEDILKFDEKVFKQIVILGSDLHTPFLKLTLPERRFLIERIFDFDTLSKIKEIAKGDYKEKEKTLIELKNKNQIVLTKINSLKDEKERIDKENKRIEENKKCVIGKIEIEKKLIEDSIEQMKSKINEKIDEKKKEEYEEKLCDIGIEINDINNEKSNRLKKENDKLNEEYIELHNDKIGIENDIKNIAGKIKEKNKIIADNSYKTIENDELKNEIELLKTGETGLKHIDIYKIEFFEKVNKKIFEIDLEYAKLIKRIKFYENNDSCEVCGTIFTNEKKKNIIESIKIDLNDYNEKKKIYDGKLKELNKDKDDIIRKLKESIEKAEKNIKLIKKNIEKENERRKDLLIKEIGELERENDKIFLNSIDIGNKIKVFENKKREIEEKIESDFNSQIEKLIEEKNRILKEKLSFENKLKEQVEFKNGIALNLQKMNMLNERIQEQENIELISCERVDKDLLNFRKEYKICNDDIDKKERYLKYVEKIIDMFSDKGIRSVLIQKYLPLLNNKMFEFLNEFNCNFNIEFDNNFNTVIKNRNEDVSYGTYSSGQRQRMNLAILFTFMEFMKLKQGVNCNLLIFDEILDSSLDEDGIEIFFKLLEGFSLKEKYSIFVISHRESNINYFQNIYKVEMKDKFSKIEKVVM